MLILITSEKLVERRVPHLAANRAVPPRLGEHARNSNKNGEKHWRAKNKQPKNKMATAKVSVSFALRGWPKNGLFSSPTSKQEENSVAQCMDELSKTTWMAHISLQWLQQWWERGVKAECWRHSGNYCNQRVKPNSTTLNALHIWD